MEDTMAKKHKASISIVFGEYFSDYVEDVISAVHNAEEQGEDGIKAGAKYLKEECMDGECFNVFTREFDTEDEVNAYLMGISDMDGWMDHYQLDQNQVEILNKVIAERDK